MLKTISARVKLMLKKERRRNTPKTNSKKIKVKNFWKQGMGMGRKEGEGNPRVA